MTDYTKLVEALRCRIPNPPEGCEGCTYNMGGVCYANGMMTDAADAIEALQAEIRESLQRCAECGDELAQQMPKRGVWKPFDLTWGRSIYSCTVCGEAADVPTANGKVLYKYCPNCGAKMEVQDG